MKTARAENDEMRLVLVIGVMLFVFGLSGFGVGGGARGSRWSGGFSTNERIVMALGAGLVTAAWARKEKSE